MSKFLSLAVAGTVLVVSGGTMGAASAFAKDVTLVVDGVPTQVRVGDATVAQVLIKQGLKLSPHDVVSPAVTEKVSDGSQVTVQFARPLTVTVDGETETRWTTATTVDAALAQMMWRAENGSLSVSRSMTIGREGAAFALEQAKRVDVASKVGTQRVELLGTVGDALAKAGVVTDADDIVVPVPETPLTDAMSIKVTAVEAPQDLKILPIPFTSTTVESADLPQGSTRVQTPGVAGEVVEIWERRYHDGELISTTHLGDQSRTEPVNEVIEVGTYVKPAPAAAPAPVAKAPVAEAPVVPVAAAAKPAVAVAPAPVAAVAKTPVAAVATAPVAKAPVAPAPAPAPAPVSYSGSHSEWMAAAGIPSGSWGYVEKLIQKESSWNPRAVNSSSGACGLVQALPCSKLGPNWSSPVVALAWANGYVNARYGGWGGAWAHSLSHGWY